MLAQEARKRQGVVKYALKNGKSKATKQYGVSLSSVKRWCKRYDGTWQSLLERSHRPKSHPKQHTSEENVALTKAFSAKFFRYGWLGVYTELQEKHNYKRSFCGMYRRAKVLGFGGKISKATAPRKCLRKYPELLIPGEKVQVDVKEVPYHCLKGKIKADGKHLYQWTAIDECTRIRFIYAFEEHTPENSVKFLNMVKQVFSFKITTVQTDNGTEFTYKFISETKVCPFDKALEQAGIKHKLIPPRTPWHNGKVERSHRNDQRYFYNHEKFESLEELNQKLSQHLKWSNSRPMRILGGISPSHKLNSLLVA
jgi:transposase